MNEIRNLNIFCAVYEAQSISKGALTMDISQPAVSRTIRELEKDYQTILFEKSGRGIVPTVQADILYRYANNLQKEMNDLKKDILHQNRFGNFSIGCTLDLAESLLIPAIKQMSIEYPDTKISMMIGSGYSIYKLLENNKLDLAMIEDFNVERDLNSVELPDYTKVLLVAKGHPLYEKTSVTLSELTAYKLAVKCNNLETTNGTEREFHNRNMHPDVICRSNSITAIIDLVLSGYCVSILPISMAARFINVYNDWLKLIDIEDLSVIKDNKIIYGKYKVLNQPAKRLIELLTSTAH